MTNIPSYRIIVMDDDGGNYRSVNDAVSDKVRTNYHCKRRPAEFWRFITKSMLFLSNWNKLDYIIFIGHTFVYDLFDTAWKQEFWKQIKAKKILWCSERIDCIVEEWLPPSRKALNDPRQIMDYIFVCDEDDFNNYKDFLFLPQWGSPAFQCAIPFEKKENKLVFIGQSGLKGYENRTALLQSVKNDFFLKDHFIQLTNSRSLGWKEFVHKVGSYKYLINPIGNLISFNTRLFEALQAGCIVFQQVNDRFIIHKDLIPDNKAVVYFETLDDLREKFTDIIKDENKIKLISANAAEVGKIHTWQSRWETILESIYNYEKDKSNRCSLGNVISKVNKTIVGKK